MSRVAGRPPRRLLRPEHMPPRPAPRRHPSPCPRPSTGRYLWSTILGPCAPALDAICAQHSDGAAMAGRAAHIADHSKAFKRLGLAWCRTVLAAEAYPLWHRGGLLLQVIGREVAPHPEGGGAECSMQLGRGIGMGGTSSVLSWGTAHDPAIYATEAAAGAACPTHVDDTACLATSTRGAMRAMIALLAASHIAGRRP